MRDALDRWTLLILAAVAVFMVWAAGRYTVFDDEAFSCRRYVMPMGEMLSALWHGAEPDPPLYYVLQNLWIRFFGVGPLAIRSLSIIIFMIGLIFIRFAGQAWFNRGAGLTAMVICAVHPAHLFFGFAARWYSLMFLCTAAILWLTARLSAKNQLPHQPESPARAHHARTRPPSLALRAGSIRLCFAWSIVAAAACYTNYFGPVVAALALLAGVLRGYGVAGDARRLVWSAIVAVFLYGPWLLPFFGQVFGFPVAAFSWTVVGAAFARTLMALLAGNLASVDARWVWVPLGVFCVAIFILSILQWKAARLIVLFVVGCLLIGAASRTMLDKYVMTFSGAACLLVAALLRWPSRSDEPSRPRRLTIRLWSVTAGACLAVGWIACGVNLVTERCWSSLRWLDPFEQVIAEASAMPDAPPPPQWIMTHPSARYYFGCRSARQEAGAAASPSWRIAPQAWRRYAEWPSSALGNFDLACGTPASILDRMKSAPVSSLLTVETTGFRELADKWGDLLEILQASYVVTLERRYLKDEEAALKDRIDPLVAHPRWRVVVRRWDLQ